jgi:hypothetical protein
MRRKLRFPASSWQVRTPALGSLAAAASALTPTFAVSEGSMTEVSLVLNSGAYSAIPRQDGSFVFHEVRCPL